MASLMEKYDKIIELINNDNLTWVRHSGVPFIICLYEKEEHKDTLSIIDRLKNEIDDFNLIVINMEQLIFDIIEKYENVESIIELEKSDENVDLTDELGELLLNEIREYIISKSKELGTNGRILITRVGSSVVYFNFIRLISYLEGRVQIPIVFLYPGTYDKYSVKLLNKYKETALRAIII